MTKLGKKRALLVTSPSKSRAKRITDMRVRIRLDKRRALNDGTYPLVIAFTFRGSTTLIPTSIYVTEDQYNETTSKITNHPQKVIYNNYLSTRLAQVQNALTELQFSGALDDVFRGSEVKDILLSHLDGEPREESEIEQENGSRFVEVFMRFVATRNRPRTREIYLHTLDKVLGFSPSPEELTFEEVNRDWLYSFKSYLEEGSLSVNSISIHLRNIRAVFNYAIDEEITTAYPFRRFKIRTEETRKRSLTIEQLRSFFSAEVTADQELHLDMFKLVFYLIGINMADLSRITRIEGGRIYYTRAKTGRPYSIKVEPEALAIINKYRGEMYLLSPFDRYANYRDYAKRMNLSLKTIGYTEIGKHGKRTYRPLHPEISVYWARHTWATMASKLDIPKETIAHALGHGAKTTTDIYIDFDERKVDEANRRVIDFVLYDKK